MILLIFGFILHLEGFGSMENTPTGCGSHLYTILRTFKNDRKSRSVNNSLEWSDLDPNSTKDFFDQPELRLGMDVVFVRHFLISFHLDSSSSS